MFASPLLVKPHLLALVAAMSFALPAFAGGPRFVTGSTYSVAGVPMAFGNTSPLYFTDPGNLNATVTHAQADTIVAAAAAVWNSPYASLLLAKGGTLAEHVSSANVYFDGSAMVFPADVKPTNFQNIPIAVIYDTDGSVTDLLLGQGASDPSSCRQNEVTESVDGFGADGTIQHALLILNGRCVSNTTDSLMQLQYMLMRGFGRVIGLGWSQTNDNVFTGAPLPTSDQMDYWPVMHPIDVTCGSYTYKCMVNPFVLRTDDISTLALLYPVTMANQRMGQTVSTPSQMSWFLFFPGLQGMDMVNATLSLRYVSNSVQAGWQVVSGLTGYLYQQNTGNPVTGPEDTEDNVGGTVGYRDGLATLSITPTPSTVQGATMAWEPVNPLYTGAYALGPFQRPPTMYAGTETSAIVTTSYTQFTSEPTDAGSTCNTSTNGTEKAPHAEDPTGWWTDVLCGRSRPAWGSVTVRGGRSWSLEVTTLDGNGLVSTAKAQPVLGVWNAADLTGTLPTVAAQVAPMNSPSAGVTQLEVSAASGSSSYRFTIADFYGGGRPDFQYRARIFYADSIMPATVGTSGGQITITGTGFANGNRVTVNGVVAKVISWAANTIIAVAPTSIAAKATAGMPVDVEVSDMATGGTTTISGALTYGSGSAYSLVKLAAPASLETGVLSATAFAVKVLAGDGITAVPGASVQVAVTSGSAVLQACGAASSCTLTTDASGVVSTAITGSAAGMVTLTATAVSGGATVQVSMMDSNPVRRVVIDTAAAYVAAGATVLVPVTLHAVQDNLAATGVAVSWSATGGASPSAATTPTGSDGSATVMVSSNKMSAGVSTVQACAWTTVCVPWSMTAVAAAQWVPEVVSGAGQSIAYTSAFAPVVLRVTDGSGHALQGATVTVAQTVTAWQGACPARGRCPAAPLLASNSAAAVTDANGLVTIAPLVIPDVPQTVNIAVSTGTAGFVALSLVKTP
jgi:hypothetical protein